MRLVLIIIVVVEGGAVVVANLKHVRGASRAAYAGRGLELEAAHDADVLQMVQEQLQHHGGHVVYIRPAGCAGGGEFSVGCPILIHFDHFFGPGLTHFFCPCLQLKLRPVATLC